MNNWTELIVNNYHRFSRVGVLVASIVFIAFIMPQSSFNFNFEKGRPWQYEDLLAPFNFPVLKTTDNYTDDINSIKENFVPYYEVLDITSTRIGSFRASMDLRLNEVPDSLLEFSRATYYDVGEKLINEIYKKGLLQLNSEHLQKEVIYIQGDSKSVLRQINDFYNRASVNNLIDEYIFKKDPIDFQLVKSVLTQHLLPNVIENAALNNKTLNNSIRNVSKYEQGLQKGENIVTTGEIISDETFQQLISLREEYKNRTNESSFISLRLLGYLIICSICFLVLFVYLRIYEGAIYSSLRKYTFIFLLVVMFLGITRILVNGDFDAANLYLIPFCVLPILLRSFFGVGIFSYVYLTTLVLSYFILPVGYDYLLLNLVVGYIAFESSSRTYYWSQFFTVIGIVLIAYIAGFTGLELIRNNSISAINFSVYPFLFANAMLTLLAYPLIPIFEKFFGFLSNISLVELGDLNKPLLRELQDKAPGTMHHSLEVANLAENAANEIGADRLLVKVAALYHDIGKMKKPIYFIENQENINNPHDEIGPKESAKIIIDHIIDGIELAKEHNLPNILIDFIRTHHGKSRVEYFYRQYLEANPESEDEEELFTYPGPLPFSKETALLMLADSVEAAAKSLKNPTGVEIDAFIDKIIDFKISLNQLDKCDLSFRDLRAIRKSFKRSLRSKYHIRIEYPAKKQTENKKPEL